MVDGRYRVVDVVAVGGIGAVYRAIDRESGGRVAIKVLSPEAEAFALHAVRMEREYQIGATVRHPNVIRAFGRGDTEDGGTYLVSEYLEGRTLRELMKQGPVPVARAVRIARQLFEGLGACHAAGVLHRDLKPTNVMIDEAAFDLVKVIDFGLARCPSWSRDDVPEDEVSTQQQLTTGSVVFGTLAYMAPETALGMRSVDARGDLYAAGVVLYELLAGKHPFDGTDPAETFLHHRVMPPPRFEARVPGLGVPPALEAVVMRLLAKRPADRYASAGEVIAALTELELEDEPPAEARPPRAGSSLLNAASTVAPPSATRRVPWVHIGLGAGIVALGAAFAALRGGETQPRAFDPMPAVSEHSAWEPVFVVSTPEPDGRGERAAFRAQVELERWNAATDALVALIAAAPDPLREAEDQERAYRVGLRAAFGKAPRADELFEALAHDAGAPGLDVLYAMVESQGGSRGAALAAEKLALPEVRVRLSPAVAVSMDLREASCKNKRAFFERAGQDGDIRTLRTLELLRSHRCLPQKGHCCYHKDPTLEDAVRAIERRR